MRHMTKRAFRPAFDDLEGRRLLATLDVNLPETSPFAPAVASFNGKIYIAWTGTDSGHHLNVESSSDSTYFSNKVTLPESSIAAPALAVFGGKLYIAWTDTAHHLNVESSSNGVV